MSYSERFDQALAFASDLHRDQIRKGNEVPYVTHLLGVASLVGANGGDEDQVIAALLHDAIEDGDDPDEVRRQIEDRFGARVLEIVDDCTDADDHEAVSWSTRKQHYLRHLREAPDEAPSILISLADKLYNARSILRDVRDEGAMVFERFRAGRGGVRWYYGRLAEILCDKRTGWLADELARVVGEIESEIERTDSGELSDAKRLVAELGERLGDDIELWDLVETVTAESRRWGGFVAYVVPDTLRVSARLYIAPDEGEAIEPDAPRAEQFETAARERLEETWSEWDRFGFERDGEAETTYRPAAVSLGIDSLVLEQPVTYRASDVDEAASVVDWLDANLLERV